MYLECIPILILLHNCVASHFFDAISDMESLVDTETKLIGNLNLYIKTEEETLKLLQKYVLHFKIF